MTSRGELERARESDRERDGGRQVKHFTWMLLLKHMFYNKIRGQRKRFSCACSYVSPGKHFPFLPLSSPFSLSPSSGLHLWMVMELTVYTANRTISHSFPFPSFRFVSSRLVCGTRSSQGNDTLKKQCWIQIVILELSSKSVEIINIYKK